MDDNSLEDAIYKLGMVMGVGGIVAMLLVGSLPWLPVTFVQEHFYLAVLQMGNPEIFVVAALVSVAGGILIVKSLHIANSIAGLFRNANNDDDY